MHRTFRSCSLGFGLVSAVLLTALLAGCAARPEVRCSTDEEAAAARAQEPPPGQALVCFFRKDGTDRGASERALVDDSAGSIVELAPGTFHVAVIDPGDRTFEVRIPMDRDEWWASKLRTFSVAPGQVLHVEVLVERKMLEVFRRIDLVEREPAEGAASIASMRCSIERVEGTFAKSGSR